MPVLALNALKKGFRGPAGALTSIIDIPTFALDEATELGLSGPSGSGKTTLLHLVAGILAPDSGTIEVAGTRLDGQPEAARDRVRARSIGYIFQAFNLLQGFTCLENIYMAMALGRGLDRAQAKELLARVGLSERADYYPRQLSTGQQQRAAVARALANRPRLVLADEPTGNLDARNRDQVLALVRETAREHQAALLLVSHEAAVLDSCRNVVDFTQLNQAAAAPR